MAIHTYKKENKVAYILFNKSHHENESSYSFYTWKWEEMSDSFLANVNCPISCKFPIRAFIIFLKLFRLPGVTLPDLLPQTANQQAPFLPPPTFYLGPQAYSRQSPSHSQELMITFSDCSLPISQRRPNCNNSYQLSQEQQRFWTNNSTTHFYTSMVK